MARKRAAKEKFMAIITNAVNEIKNNESSYMAVNTLFEVSPFLGYFTNEVKEILFKLVFNEQLLDFLKQKLDTKINGGKT